MDNQNIFRKKSLDRISSPEQTDDYIRIIIPSPWLVIIGTAIILTGVLVWAFFGQISVETADGIQMAAPVSVLMDHIR